MYPIAQSQVCFESGGKDIRVDCFLPSVSAPSGSNGGRAPSPGSAGETPVLQRFPAIIALHGSGGASFEGLDPQERSYGFHAGEVETSFLLAAMPKLVDSSAYTSNYIADIHKPELLRPENAPAIFAWLTRDIAPSGVLGDPRADSAEKGCRWIEEAATRLAAALEAMFHYAPEIETDIQLGYPADSTK